MLTKDEIRVLIIHLISKLNEAASWSGETHIQKAAYFLREFGNLDLGFSFVLHKYGPYSFDLKDELVFLESVGVLDRKASPPYGSHFSRGVHASSFESIASADVDEYGSTIDWTIDKFFKDGPGVSELELKATALYALKNFDGSADEMATRIHEIKPHISKEQALEAIQSISVIVNLPDTPSVS